MEKNAYFNYADADIFCFINKFKWKNNFNDKDNNAYKFRSSSNMLSHEH